MKILVVFVISSIFVLLFSISSIPAQRSALDEWIYALKHASKMNDEPHFLKAPGLVHFFHLAKYANLTQEERNMYRTAQQVKWDNKNGMDFQLEKALQKQALELALEMKKDGVNIDTIVKYTKVSKEQIEALT